MEISVAWRIDFYILKGSVDRTVEAGDKIDKKTRNPAMVGNHEWCHSVLT